LLITKLFLVDHFEIKAKGPVHTLTIRKVAWNEGGEYKCVADGDAKTSVTLIVKAIQVTFIKLLEERTCNFGEPVEFICETSKTCHVEWFIGNKRLSPQQIDTQSNNNQHILCISKVKLSDKGLYACAKEKKVCFILDRPVQLIEPLEGLNVQENENATLVCQLSKPDMDDIEYDDQGLYEIRRELIKTLCHVNVKKLETTFLDYLTNSNVQEGDTARFQCHLSKLCSNIQWFKDGIRILPSDRIVYSVKALPAGFIKYLLKIWTVYGDEPLELTYGIPITDKGQMKNDGLRYSLYNPHGVELGRYPIRIDDGYELESNCQVSIEDLSENKRKKPRIIRGLEDLNLQEGASLQLECLFEGNDVEATWFFDGIMIRSNFFITINFKPNELAQLIMKEVYLEDAGLYKLCLKNKYGEVSTSCTVYIRQREPSTDQRKMSIEDLSPKFIEPISDVYVHEEQEANFRAILYPVNHLYLLAKLHVNENDQCEYTCKGENSAGDKPCSANLHLIGTPISSKSQLTEEIAPSFVRKLRNCTVIVGQRAKFDSFITGQSNLTIRWLHNGLLLNIDLNTKKYSTQLHSNGKITLRIEDCLQEDTGEITIIIENRAGSTQYSAELTLEPHREANCLKRRISFDVPELSSTTKPGAILLPSTRLLLTPHSKSS
ncbi:unnamed protein product, partial [Rotaria sp. Silwood2]